MDEKKECECQALHNAEVQASSRRRQPSTPTIDRGSGVDSSIYHTTHFQRTVWPASGTAADRAVSAFIREAQYSLDSAVFLRVARPSRESQSRVQRMSTCACIGMLYGS